jgi:hypothetical protein
MKVVREWLIYRSKNSTEDGVCEVEFIERIDDVPVIIFHELENDPGYGINIAWEYIVRAAERRFTIKAPEAVWIEHTLHDVKTKKGILKRWQLITFKHPLPGHKWGKADWRDMTYDDWHELGLPPRD